MRGHPVTSESVEEFRSRARAWLAANMPPLDPAKAALLERDELSSWHRARELQKLLYEGGFAGICFPREYGGLGRSYEYKKAFDVESQAYETPLLLNVPSFAICCATILDMGTEAQKRQHISAALRGEEVLVQLLSEPNGGSDLAGVITRAERRDGRWIINGAKTWSTWAFAADYGLCLARTNWDVPKHEGLTMFWCRLPTPVSPSTASSRSTAPSNSAKSSLTTSTWATTPSSANRAWAGTSRRASSTTSGAPWATDPSTPADRESLRPTMFPSTW
jgi:alkylation response protein AidB-like acyl-CoA dehydrogenase